MIFIGNGSLLKRALQDTLSADYKIDLVISNTNELGGFCSHNSISFKTTLDINKEPVLIEKYCSDGIVLSINNSQIFKSNLLSLNGIKYYNIHNGLIPKYRGLPEVCIFFAILNDEPIYGVSLHQIDSGIDTGKCYDQFSFDIGRNDNFQDVMSKSLVYCHEIFKINLDKIVRNNLNEIEVDKSFSKLYTYKDLYNFDMDKEYKNLERAKKFGVYRLYFNKAYFIIQNKS